MGAVSGPSLTVWQILHNQYTRPGHSLTDKIASFRNCRLTNQGLGLTNRIFHLAFLISSQLLARHEMKALVLHPPSHKVSLCDLPRPEPNVGEVLVRVHAVALNPIDALYAFKPIATQEQRVIGTDFAGVVVEASTDIADTSDARTRLGARVAGFLQGGMSATFTLSSVVAD